MSGADACEALRNSFPYLFHCSRVGELERIRTPYLYPDGDNIDLYCKQTNGVKTVSDLGETTRWLRMQTLSPRRSKKQHALIEDICLTHGVEFYKGMLQARSRSDEELAAVVIRLAQAALRVADISFTFRTRAVQSAADEVADFLDEYSLPFERDEKLVGRSGRIWTVDFHVRAANRSSLVNVLATGSRPAAKAIANQVVAEWFDLNQLTVGPEALRFVTLFDDTVDVWSDSDFNLLAPISNVVRWSAPNEFAELLQAA